MKGPGWVLGTPFMHFQAPPVKLTYSKTEPQQKSPPGGRAVVLLRLVAFPQGTTGPKSPELGGGEGQWTGGVDTYPNVAQKASANGSMSLTIAPFSYKTQAGYLLWPAGSQMGYWGPQQGNN